MMMAALVQRGQTSRARSHGGKPKGGSGVLGNPSEKTEPVAAIIQELAEARDQHPMPAPHQA
jgi:hypothetical protein